MKRMGLGLIMFLISLVLFGCTNEIETKLKQSIHEYDYYMKLYEYDGNQHQVKFFMAYDFNNDFQPIFYLAKVTGKNATKLEITIDHQVIYEQVIEPKSDQGTSVFTLDATSLEETVRNKEAEVRIIDENGNIVDSNPFLFRVKTIDLRTLTEHERTRIERGSEFEEDNLKEIEENYHIYIYVILAVIVGGFLFYSVTLLLYRWIYERSLNKKLHTNNFKLNMIDLSAFKYTMRVITSVLTIISLLLIVILTGYLDYLKDGQIYFIESPKYEHVSYVLEEDFTFTIDMKQLENYDGKTVIEHDLFEVKIDSPNIRHGVVMIGLNLKSNFSFFHAKIVSESQHENRGVIYTNLDRHEPTQMRITTIIDGEIYNGKIKGWGPTDEDTRHLWIALYDGNDASINVEEIEKITIKLEDFVINEYSRK